MISAYGVGAGQDDELFQVAHRGDVRKLASLLVAAENLNPTNDEGLTPLMIAAQAGYPKMIEALLVAGADLEIRTKDGKTALI